MRIIDSILVHCSASDSLRHDNAATMDRWHKKRGWSGIGYHFYIRKDGTVEEGRSILKRGAHAKGYNNRSIGICLGGLKVEKFTEAQFEACAELINNLRSEYVIKNIVAHNFVSNKTCPVFNIVDEIFTRLK